MFVNVYDILNYFLRIKFNINKLYYIINNNYENLYIFFYKLIFVEKNNKKKIAINAIFELNLFVLYIL